MTDIDTALAGVATDIWRVMIKDEDAREVAEELTRTLALMFVGELRKVKMSNSELSAARAEWRKRRAAGYRAPVPELRPGRPTILTRPEARRIGYGTRNGGRRD